MDAFRVTILGARGSVPVSDSAFARYGGATTCVLVQAGETNIVLDAGTGILRLPSEVLANQTLTLLLTHAHLDHLNGLMMCPYVMGKGNRLDIYAAEQSGVPIEDVLLRLYSPPIWPVTPNQLTAELICHAITGDFSIGGVQVASIEGFHPGGVRLLRLRGGGRTIVFATDFTLTETSRPAVIDFARDCDLLLCDGQYSEEEWQARSGYGHNTWTAAARLGLDCGARRTRIVHHDPSHNDAFLDAAAAALRAAAPGCDFSREGEVIEL